MSQIVAILLGAVLTLMILCLVDPLIWIKNQEEIQTAQAQFVKDCMAYQVAGIDFAYLNTLYFALAAYEDQAFFSRPSWVLPVSPLGLLRAALLNIRGIRAGGSTIPQQLAKLYLRGSDVPRLSDKLRELFFAAWMMRNASKDEILGLYLNLSASGLMNERDCVQGSNRLSLALFGLPLSRLNRENQLVFAAIPRGLGRLRKDPESAQARIFAAKAWMEEHKRWDKTIPSYLDDRTAIDASTLFSFVEPWQSLLATNQAGSSDLDLSFALEAFREGLRQELSEHFPETAVRMAFAIIVPEGILVRSGSESFLMQFNYGSIAKIEPLHFAIEMLGVEEVQNRKISASPCIRWFWTKDKGRHQAAKWCPSDVTAPTGPMSMDQAVAQSINSMTARHVAMLPFLLWKLNPERFYEMIQKMAPLESQALDSDADRAISANLMQSLGDPISPENVPEELSYTFVQTALFRMLNERRAKAGLPIASLPEDPTQTLGNSSRSSIEQIGAYVHSRLFQPGGDCVFSDTGAILAKHKHEGTLRWLAHRWPDVTFSGKTGTSAHNDSAIAAVSLCLDGRPATIVSGVRPINGKLPDGFHGATLLRGIDAYLKELKHLDRHIASPGMPLWAMEAEQISRLDRQ